MLFRSLLALCATLPSEVRTPGEFLLQYTISLAMAAAGIAFCWFFARRNYLAYALVLWLMALRTPMMQLLDTGNPALQLQGWLIAAIMAASVVWAVAPAWLGRRSMLGTAISKPIYEKRSLFSMRRYTKRSRSESDRPKRKS